METYQHEFIQYIHQRQILRFGDFTLKSGRQSPYFFNIGLFNNGAMLQQLGYYFAKAIQHTKNLQFDMLFGPAYKGIPLVCTTAIALAEHNQKNYPYCFNRKEIKDHGEEGDLIGATLAGRVLLIDDVLTAGTALHSAKKLIESYNAEVAGVIIALDRQEKGSQQRSARNEIEQNWQVPVVSIIQLNDLLAYLQQQDGMNDIFEKIKTYRSIYCE